MSNENKGPQGKVFDVSSLLQKPKETQAAPPEQQTPEPPQVPSIASKEYIALASECLQAHPDLGEVMAASSQVAYAVSQGSVPVGEALGALSGILCNFVAVTAVRIVSLEEDLAAAQGGQADEVIEEMLEAAEEALEELRKTNFNKSKVIALLEKIKEVGEDHLDDGEEEDGDEG